MTVLSVVNSPSRKDSKGFRNNMKDCSCIAETKIHLLRGPIDWQEALKNIVLISLILVFSCENLLYADCCEIELLALRY